MISDAGVYTAIAKGSLCDIRFSLDNSRLKQFKSWCLQVHSVTFQANLSKHSDILIPIPSRIPLKLSCSLVRDVEEVQRRVFVVADKVLQVFDVDSKPTDKTFVFRFPPGQRYQVSNLVSEAHFSVLPFDLSVESETKSAQEKKKEEEEKRKELEKFDKLFGWVHFSLYSC